MVLEQHNALLARTRDRWRENYALAPSGKFVTPPLLITSTDHLLYGDVHCFGDADNLRSLQIRRIQI